MTDNKQTNKKSTGNLILVSLEKEKNKKKKKLETNYRLGSQLRQFNATKPNRTLCGYALMPNYGRLLIC